MNRAEAVTNNGDIASYETVQLAPVDPLSAIESLAEKELTQYYWVYGSDSETIIALDAIGEVVVDGDKIESSWAGKEIASETATDPFAQAGRMLNDMPVSNWRAYGHIAFDTAGFYYPYPLRADTPQMRFIIPKTELVITAEGTTLRTLDNPGEVASAIQNAGSHTYNSPNAPAPNLSDRDTYETQVAELINQIRAGELTKAIIARRVNLPGNIDIFATFDAIRRTNPAARTYCFNQPGLSGIGSSPELLIETTAEGKIRTTPLAGTRPRGKDAKEDEALRRELTTDAKEVKEHVMSVQLAKEELEKVCRLGSVVIKPFMDVAPFRTVQHLSSSVSGQLTVEHTLWDGLRALFPGVTVSGIDKHTAIEKIATFEQKARGPYAGCVGWVDSSGASDLAITLRSAFEDTNGVSVSAGAGIIAESVPELEYRETAHKMRTMQSQLVLRNITQ